jgi:hypothetical protein
MSRPFNFFIDPEMSHCNDISILLMDEFRCSGTDISKTPDFKISSPFPLSKQTLF